MAACYWGCDFYQAQTPALKAQCMRNYQEHTERVLREVPAERLLVFGPKDGWGPLCKFLGVQEPDVPFPNVAIQGGSLTTPIERTDVKEKVDGECCARCLRRGFWSSVLKTVGVHCVSSWACRS